MIKNIEDFFLNLDWLHKKSIQNYSPLFMGILNVTPDSFFDGGKYNRSDLLKKHIEDLITQGADIIDIGGESSRPGSVSLQEKEELERVLPAIEEVRKISNVPISIDTYKVKVAEKCISYGADIINDISGGEESNFEMIDLAIEKNIPIVLMHKKGLPATMQKQVQYENVLEEVRVYFEEKLQKIKIK